MIKEEFNRRRGKGRITADKGLTDAYDILKDHFGVDIPFAKFKEVSYAVNKKIMEELRNGRELTLPYRLGSLRIKKNKVNLNNLKVDFDYYNKTGKIKKHLNSHSDEFYFHYRWDRRTCDIVNYRYYSFVPTRENKRLLSALIKSGEKGKKDYFR